MKLRRYAGNPILERNPKQSWEAGSVLNPSVLFDDGKFRMFYRATNDTQTKKLGRYVSSIGYAESSDGIHFQRASKPIIYPNKSFEKGKGCEDPRVTKIGNEFFLYYTAVKKVGDKQKVRVALATSKNCRNWTKHGIVGPDTRSKAGLVFPKRINGKYVMFYTWMSDSPLSSIMRVGFDSINDVKKPTREVLSDNIYRYDSNVVFAPPQTVLRGPECGAVPIETSDGWLFIFCPANTKRYKEWSISAALLDLENPQKILAMSPKPILEPETKSEMIGVVPRVVFPEGAVIVGEELFVYYGSGDQGICLARCKLKSLMAYLKNYPVK